MQYTIQAVSPTVRDFTTQYGAMKSYRLKFNETDANTIVELAQKATSPAPKVGDVLNGTIDTSSQYGPKFKKEQTGFGGGNSFSGNRQSGGSQRNFDDYTMYLSYAKDIAVALIAAGRDMSEFGDILDTIAEGGDYLKDHHTKPKSKDVVADDVDDTIDLSGVDETVKQVQDTMSGGEQVNLADIPF